MQKTSRIQIDVGLDEKNIPMAISWMAEDGEFESPQTANAMLLSLWDPQAKNTLSIDLWTGEMTVHEMNIMVFQVIKKLSETCIKATGNKELEQLFIRFGNDFADKTEITKK